MSAAADQSQSTPIGSLPVGVTPAEWPGRELCCDACERSAAVRGCRRFGRYTLCPRCNEEYVQAWAAGRRVSPGQYVRDKHFDEGELYALEPRA